MSAQRAEIDRVTDEDGCLSWLWLQRFSDDGLHAHCPSCDHRRPFQRIGRAWRCQICGGSIDVTSDTVFARSSVPLLTWFTLIALLRNNLVDNVSDFSRRLAIPYATAWRMRQRLDKLDTEALEWTVPTPLGALPESTDEVSTPPSLEPRSKEPRDRESTTGRLLEAAQRAIIKRGVAGMRVADVGREAGVAPATILYSFGSKDALLVAALERLYEQSEAAMRERFTELASATERLVALATFSIGINVSLDEHRLEFEFLARAIRDQRLRPRCEKNDEVWHEIVVDVLHLGVERGEFALDSDASDVADTLALLWNALNLRLLLEYRELPPERALRLGLSSASGLVGVPLDRLTELARRELLRRPVA
ncbi:TetR family transcriptional regulator [Nocardia sp. NPDC047648]|uniref:TetR/AcrR family transcriptional regulator n=1 Tax=Nocardia sp. NPDC047648 TaxID=3155625 RepID=UPI003408C138